MILDNNFENLEAIRNNETLNLSKDTIKKEVIIEQEDFKEELRKIANDFDSIEEINELLIKKLSL